MDQTAYRAIAIVGVGAILPDADSAPQFWQNIKSGRYSISEVDKGRWDPALYYDPDPHAPEKTYSKIGGWVGSWEWDPHKWGLALPPRVSDAMDLSQKWAVACTAQALQDYGYPKRALNTERTAVILGNAMAGERHYMTALRIYFPEYAEELAAAPSFAALPAATRAAITAELHSGSGRRFPPISEDTMPGELSNCIAGRIANLFNFHGPNYVVDAACASAMAAISAAIEGLCEKDFDVVIAGGIDRNMGAATFVKFSKIGALSATGTRPYADGADGFVMGEGGAIFVLKRLADAERAGDRIYAVIRGVGGSSDGKGKGITAPNPIGQRLCVERAWNNAGLSPGVVSLIEGHGTSTRVGDVVEVQALSEVLAAAGAAPGSVALGSVKSNIGHLKAAAGAAGLLKLTLALHDKLLPPSLSCSRLNPNIDFVHSPLRVNTELRDWPTPPAGVRVAGLSAFGFGGTNFHLVLQEYVPGLLPDRSQVAVPAAPSLKAPLRGALVVGAASEAALTARLQALQEQLSGGVAPLPAPPAEADLRAAERIAIDYGDAAELVDKLHKAHRALSTGSGRGVWRPLRAQGIFRGSGPAPKVAFLFTGQGSQYPNMLARLREHESAVRQTFAEADAVMMPLLGQPLSEYLFTSRDPAAEARAEEALRQTAITQPAVLATDCALARLLAAYGVVPDMVMGHSLGEYSALVAADALSFADALLAVSARGREMTELAVADNGSLAAVFAPLTDIERILAEVGDDDVVIANVNSTRQAVIGGGTAAMTRAMAACSAAGYKVVQLPVSHAFHTRIVAPASEPLRKTLEALRLRSPALPVIANVHGELYPRGPGVEPQMIDLLSRQVSSPVQFVKGLRTLYQAGVRLFVEVGPKKALQGFVDDVFADQPEVASLFTNHPKLLDEVAFNQALCGLYAAGLGAGAAAEQATVVPAAVAGAAVGSAAAARAAVSAPAPVASAAVAAPAADPRIVITGAALGLPGTGRVFDDENIGRILGGEQLIDVVPTSFRRAMLDKHITRVVKSESGDPVFALVDNLDEVIRLAGRGGAFDLGSEFGVAAERLPALDIVTRLAIGAGIDALRDAGIPLVLRYKTTSKGTRLPDRYMLPESLRDDTGVIFASAFPGYDAFADELTRYHEDHSRREQLAVLSDLRGRLGETDPRGLAEELDRRIHKLQADLQKHPYAFDRRFLFRILAMGHSQFAELLGARGPNTQINSACASSTQAVALAWDWIRAGRCRRVVIVAGDDVTSEHLLEWMGAGFLASGAAATDDIVEEAAVPFDRRRHGMILGMGAAALVVESEEASAERGLSPICEVLAATTANSAFHGTRLDVEHIGEIMERLVSEAERRGAITRQQMAAQTVFISHETYTPSRGGSAAAEIHALRRVFGSDAEHVVIANTKGFTGHAMAVGIEDVVAVKALETGIVPPVANFRDSDPELGTLNLSRGGAYPVRYALRLGAGFGSQISMTCLRWVPTRDGKRREPDALGYGYRIVDEAAWQGWLSRASGQAAPTLEVSHRTLRVADSGKAATQAQPAAPAIAPPKSAPKPAVPAAPLPVSAVAMPAAAVKTVAPAAPVAPVKPVTPVTPATTADDVKERVLALMAEKTGYAVDMLDPELDLEADLGIDTVKQAEIFATIRQAYGIPRDDQLKLRDYPTIAKVLGFVRERRTDRAAVAAAPAQAAVAAAPAEAARAPRPEPIGVAAAPPPPSAVAAAPEAEDDVKERVLALMAEKTGYAVDMLDPELDLEADLGIDTVKQAEIFATIRQAYGIPRDDQLKLRDYPTIAKVLGFVRERRTDRAAVTAAPAAADQAPRPESASMAAAASMQRRVPVPVVRPPLAWCKPTGVSFEAGQRVLVALDRGGVGRSLTSALRELGVEVLAAEPVELVSQAAEWLTRGPVHGVYWLPALDAEDALEGLELTGWRAALAVRVKQLYALMRALYEHIAQAGTFLIAATRMGGQHGYGATGAENPMGGAVSGFVKAYKRERPAALVKVVDFTADCAAADLADLLQKEAVSDPGAVEIGYRGGVRWSVGLVDRSAEDGQPALPLSPDSVFVVTGAAGGIVSAIVADLAAASGGTFFLLDKAPPPSAEDPDLAQFASDREGLKRTLFERHKAHGERATPAQVERDLALLERAHAAQTAIASVRAAGGTAHYRCVDLTDADAVAQVLAEVERDRGRIDVLIHAAGLEISRMLADKEPREFDLVFDVKSDGFFNLMHAAARLPIGALVVFSSIAGRFGNGGQTDYCAANDLLCKMTSYLQRTRPALRGLALDWTAWGGIGMASRGSIPKLMEQAGIDMLPPEIGVPIVRHELTTGGARGEVVIGRRLGAMTAEWDAQGGLHPASLPETAGPMLGRVVGMGLFSGLTTEVLLDPQQQPFLHDHQIEGIAVLPGVMGIEAFAELAALALPGWQVQALDQVEFLAPLKFYRGEPRPLTLSALLRTQGEEVIAECRLTTRRVLAGQTEPQETLHFSGNVRLARTPAAPLTTVPPPPQEDGRSVGWAEVYRIYFHGPAYQVLSAAWGDGGGVVGRLAELLPDNHHPASRPLLFAPRLIELCFQTAGIWELAHSGCMALPSRVEHVAVRQVAAPVGQLCAVVRPRAGGEGFDAQVVDERGQVLVELLGYHTIRLEGGPAPALLQPLRGALTRS